MACRDPGSLGQRKSDSSRRKPEVVQVLDLPGKELERMNSREGAPLEIRSVLGKRCESRGPKQRGWTLGGQGRDHQSCG